MQYGVSFPAVLAWMKSLEPQNSVLLAKNPTMIIVAETKQCNKDKSCP